jgi:hypothetical protein
MDALARLPANDRADLFLAAARKRGITTAIMEKDFWVCWTLRRVFSLSNPPASLIFKGGTSLSKVYGAIDRFSEDVDLSFDRAGLGFGGDDDPMNAQSRKKGQQGVKALSAKCVEIVQGTLLEHLTAQFGEALEQEPGSWSLAIADDEPATLNFTYPRNEEETVGVPYVRPMVRLEFGARSDHWPAQDAVVTPYVAEEFTDRVANPKCRLKVLAGARTFWEKATILHQWHHADAERAFPDRQSRHYYDVACLAQHPIGHKVLDNTELLVEVAKHKSVFFERTWARYDLAKPGTLRLVPKPERVPALEADYEKMREMIFGEVPTMEQIIATLESLEARINESATSD